LRYLFRYSQSRGFNASGGALAVKGGAQECPYTYMQEGEYRSPEGATPETIRKRA
jgi:hypothetical protein